MRLAFFRRDADAAYRLVPFVSSLAAVIVSVLPLQIPGLTIATPAFALMAIYHWIVYRPDLMPPSAVFAVGIALDLLDGTRYIGLSALIFLIVRSAILAGRSRTANQPFVVVWLGFLAVAALATAGEWLAVSVMSATALSSRAFVFQALVTVAAYPVADYLLAQLQRGLLRRV